MYNPYWLLWEIENNKLYYDLNEIKNYLDVDTLKLVYTENKLIELGKINNKEFEIEIKIPKLICTKNDFTYDDIVPLYTKKLPFIINEHQFKMEALEYEFFGDTETKRIEKATKVLRNLYTKYKLFEGNGFFTIVDWESSLKLWKKYIFLDFDTCKYIN